MNIHLFATKISCECQPQFEPYLNEDLTKNHFCDEKFPGNRLFEGPMGEDKFKLGTSSYIAIASYQHPFPERVYHLAREALLSGGFLAMDMGNPFVSNFRKKQLYKCHLCVPNLSSLVSLILTIQIAVVLGKARTDSRISLCGFGFHGLHRWDLYPWMQQLCQPCHYGGGLWSRLLEVFELLG